MTDLVQALNITKLLVEQGQHVLGSLVHDVGRVGVELDGVLKDEPREAGKFIAETDLACVHLGSDGSQVHRVGDNLVVGGEVESDWVDRLGEDGPGKSIFILHEIKDDLALFHYANTLGLRVIIVKSLHGLGGTGGLPPDQRSRRGLGNTNSGRFGLGGGLGGSWRRSCTWDDRVHPVELDVAASVAAHDERADQGELANLVDANSVDVEGSRLILAELENNLLFNDCLELCSTLELEGALVIGRVDGESRRTQTGWRNGRCCLRRIVSLVLGLATVTGSLLHCLGVLLCSMSLKTKVEVTRLAIRVMLPRHGPLPSASVGAIWIDSEDAARDGRVGAVIGILDRFDNRLGLAFVWDLNVVEAECRRSVRLCRFGGLGRRRSLEGSRGSRRCLGLDLEGLEVTEDGEDVVLGESPGDAILAKDVAASALDVVVAFVVFAKLEGNIALHDLRPLAVLARHIEPTSILSGDRECIGANHGSVLVLELIAQSLGIIRIGLEKVETRGPEAGHPMNGILTQKTIASDALELATKTNDFFRVGLRRRRKRAGSGRIIATVAVLLRLLAAHLGGRGSSGIGCWLCRLDVSLA